MEKLSSNFVAWVTLVYLLAETSSNTMWFRFCLNIIIILNPFALYSPGSVASSSLSCLVPLCLGSRIQKKKSVCGKLMKMRGDLKTRSEGRRPTDISLTRRSSHRIVENCQTLAQPMYSGTTSCEIVSLHPPLPPCFLHLSCNPPPSPHLIEGN